MKLKILALIPALALTCCSGPPLQKAVIGNSFQTLVLKGPMTGTTGTTTPLVDNAMSAALHNLDTSQTLQAKTAPEIQQPEIRQPQEPVTENTQALTSTQISNPGNGAQTSLENILAGKNDPAETRNTDDNSNQITSSKILPPLETPKKSRRAQNNTSIFANNTNPANQAYQKQILQINQQATTQTAPKTNQAASKNDNKWSIGTTNPQAIKDLF